jgi:hypothetical protein
MSQAYSIVYFFNRNINCGTDLSNLFNNKISHINLKLGKFQFASKGFFWMGKDYLVCT